MTAACDGLCLVFAYGSVIDSKSRAATFGDAGSDACAARLLPSAGFVRSWCFRAPSGFTALGLHEGRTVGASVNGILLEVPPSLLALLDTREAGYTRVRLQPNDVEVTGGCAVAQALRDKLATPGVTVYAYVPERHELADEDFPVLQSYLVRVKFSRADACVLTPSSPQDVCLTGCLEVGGEAFAAEFLSSTTEWPRFFLDDTPASRRPWQSRGASHARHDMLLCSHAPAGFAARKNPEAFAAAWLTGLRGLWGVPRRNSLFCGREPELAAIEAGLHGGGGSSGGGVSLVELVGLGGMGKSQLAAEFSHRQFTAGYYGFVAWVSAHTAEGLLADLRRLAADCGVDLGDAPAAAAVEALRARLARAHFPWLLVFDDAESIAPVAAVLPRGCGAAHAGHVLVTSRIASDAALLPSSSSARGASSPTAPAPPPRVVQLASWTPSASAAFLSRAGVPPDDASQRLAVVLGHHPLALAVAAAYLSRTDTDAASFLRRSATAAPALLARAGEEVRIPPYLSRLQT